MIRVRIPPSPTGLLHIGTARTALYNYLFAKHNKDGGQIVFRSEDTDKERSKPEYERDIIDGLHKLGIGWDEGPDIGGPHAPYRQSERTEIYKKYLKELVEKDHAYYCFCSKERLDKMREDQATKKLPPRYDGTCAKLDPKESAKRVKAGEKAVIRLRVAQGKDLKWNDGVRGETAISSNELDDFVIAKNLDEPLYNFTVVVDDHTMEITHVIRGEDHISNTPKQILIYQAFGWELPKLYAHLPLILNEDRTKMSKRKNKVSLNEYLNEGYLPEALVNFLALLGWNPGEGEMNEIFSMENLIKKFSLEHVHKGGAIFDIKKLDWINGEYIKKAIRDDVDGFCKKYDSFIGARFPNADLKLLKNILKDLDFQGRFHKITEIPEALSVFFERPDYDKKLILNEKFKIDANTAKAVLKKAIESLHNDINWVPGGEIVGSADFVPANTKDYLFFKITSIPGDLSLKNGQVLWPIRVALSGSERSPDFTTLMVYLGKEETLRRLDTALSKL